MTHELFGVSIDSLGIIYPQKSFRNQTIFQTTLRDALCVMLCMCKFDNQLEIKHRLRLYHMFHFNMDQVSSTGRSHKARREKTKAVKAQ